MLESANFLAERLRTLPRSDRTRLEPRLQCGGHLARPSYGERILRRLSNRQTLRPQTAWHSTSAAGGSASIGGYVSVTPTVKCIWLTFVSLSASCRPFLHLSSGI